MKLSRKFINENPDITFDKISDELWKFWIVDDIHAKDLHLTHEFMVFLYAYEQHLKKKGTLNSTVVSEKIARHFTFFQILLAIKNEPVKPLKIFDFSKYDRYKINGV